MAYQEIKLTRRDVARGEIHTAIDLLILGGDPVSCHVLASAASDVLRGVANATGKRTFDSAMEEYIGTEHLTDYRKHVSCNYNFFKHAKDDPFRELGNFRPETTVIELFSAVADYSSVYGQITAPMTIFKAWFICRYPTWFQAPLDKVAEAIKPHLGHPEGLPLAESLKEARMLLATIKHDPTIFLEAVGGAQLDPIGNIEF